MKRRHFLKHLGLAVSLPWIGPSALQAAKPAQRANPTRLKILSCNIRVDVAADARTGNGWSNRKELCAEVMRALRADVICLQECQQAQLQYLKSQLSGFDSFALTSPGERSDPANAILFSRTHYEMTSAGGFWLSERPHVADSKSWDSAYPRLVNWVHLKERISGKELRVWNTHLDHLGQIAREKQAELIMQASAVFPQAFPQLLAGDFNADATNQAVKLVREAGWTDTYAMVHGPEDPGFTYHGFMGPRYGENNPQAKRLGKIDWIWCRGEVKVRAAEVIRDGRKGRCPSDHYFVSAVLTL